MTCFFGTGLGTIMFIAQIVESAPDIADTIGNWFEVHEILVYQLRQMFVSPSTVSPKESESTSQLHCGSKTKELHQYLRGLACIAFHARAVLKRDEPSASN